MRTLFKGGTVITGRGPKRADVLIEGEKVKQVGRLILRSKAASTTEYDSRPFTRAILLGGLFVWG